MMPGHLALEGGEGFLEEGGLVSRPGASVHQTRDGWKYGSLDSGEAREHERMGARAW